MIEIRIVKLNENEKFITYTLLYTVLNACGLYSQLTALRLTQLHQRGLFVMLQALTDSLSLIRCPPNVCNYLPFLQESK